MLKNSVKQAATQDSVTQNSYRKIQSVHVR